MQALEPAHVELSEEPIELSDSKQFSDQDAGGASSPSHPPPLSTVSSGSKPIVVVQPSTRSRVNNDAQWSPWFYLSDQFSKLLSKFTRRQGSRTKLNVPWFQRALWTDKERDVVELYARAVLSMHSSIMFWVGASNFLSESATFDDDKSVTIFPPSIYREFAYIVIGIVLLFATDSFYGNSGLPGSFLRQKWRWNRRPFVVIIRATFSMLGSVFSWTGIYNVFDLYVYVESSAVRDWIYLIIGVSGTVLTNTFYDMSMVHPPGYQHLEFDHSTFTFRMHLRESFRALLSLVFQNLIWCGGYNLLESGVDPVISCWWREVSYVASGILFLYLTKAFIPNAWVLDELPQSDFTELKQHEAVGGKEVKDNRLNEHSPRIPIEDNFIEVGSPAEIDHTDAAAEEALTVSFYIRAMIALMSQIVHNTGVWQLFDSYISQDSIGRNIAYLLIGLIVVLLTGGGAKHSRIMIFDLQQGYIPSPLTSERFR
jgi:hypothetical protein